MVLSGVRLQTWLQRSALPTPGISPWAKCLCLPILALLPLIALYLRRQTFPIGSGAMRDLLGHLLPLHPTRPLIYTPHQQLKSLAHPPAGLPRMTISALTCTSDTPVPRLISPESVSSAVIASARHLQAPDSLSPKDFLKDIEFLTRVSSGCLEKDVAQNYSKIAFSYFFMQLLNKYQNAKLPLGLENGIKSSNKHEKMDTDVSISNKMFHA